MDNETLQRKPISERSPKSKVRARCPECNVWVNLRDHAEVWDLVTCSGCHTLLEVVDLRPPTLEHASDDLDDEDWDDEDWGDGHKKRP